MSLDVSSEEVGVEQVDRVVEGFGLHVQLFSQVKHPLDEALSVAEVEGGLVEGSV
jgi:hypothetical protein